MVNAKEMMRRLREERKTKDAPIDATAPAQPPPATPRVQESSTASACTASSAASTSSSNKWLWQEESLFERCVTLEGGIGPGRGSVLRLLEDPLGTLAGGNGATLWDCSLALTRFLAERYQNESLEGKVVLELGAGIGLVGMAMAAMGAARVTCTERGLALRLLEKNVAHNRQVTNDRVQVVELSWDQDATRKLMQKRDTAGLPSFDIVLGSDLVFPSNADTYVLLADTLHILLQHGKLTDLEVWLSHEPRRPEVEARFWTMLADRGILAHPLTAGLPASHPGDIVIMRLQLNDISS